MAFQWQMLIENAAPPVGSEQWSIVNLPTPPGLVRYGYRPVIPGGVRESWNTAGYFSIAQLVAGQLIAGRTNIMPLVPQVGGFMVRALGPGDFDVIVEGSQAIGFMYYVHRWVPVQSMQIWGLVDV
jgi:hypothetical protein